VDGTYWAVSGNETAPTVDPTTGVAEKTVTVNLASEGLSGHLNRDDHSWCTYTYDIVAREHEGVRDGEGNLIVSDCYGLKEPYCMWVPKNPPGQTEGEGHSVWVHVPEAENAPAELRVKYAINDQCLTPRAQDFNLIVVDPLLQERKAFGGPWPDTTGVMHGVEDVDEDGQPDGIKVYEFTDDDPGGTWRVLWTAQAPCGTKTRYRRTHDAQRMLVANGTTVPNATFQVWYDWNCGEDCGLNSYPADWQIIRSAFELGAKVRYEAQEAKLKVDNRMAAGATLDTLTPIQLAKVVPYHVTTVFQSSAYVGEFVGGLTYRADGTPTNPDRCRYCEENVLASAPGDLDKTTGDGQDRLKIARAQVILHELGHAADASEHAPEAKPCVMDRVLGPQFYKRIPGKWGPAPHCNDHIDQIRKHLHYGRLRR